jgi:dTDP-4-amino-4,6-dideoxygalactose transaminase
MNSQSQVRFEGFLLGNFNLEPWHFANRASKLLYIFLQEYTNKDDVILLPANACHALAQTILLAKRTIHFVDINIDDYNISLETLKSAIITAPKPPRVLIAVHSFGHFLELDKVSKYCSEKSIFLIEDRCILFNKDDTAHESDAVLLSFGNNKPFDAGGGGAMHIRDVNLSHQIAKLLKSWNDIPESKAVAMSFSQEYYQIREREIELGIERGGIQVLTHKYKDFILNGTNRIDFDACINVSKNIALSNMVRKKNFEYLFSKLEGTKGITLASPNLKSVPWRFSFLLKEQSGRDALLEALRSKIQHASKWYPSIDADFDTRNLECTTALDVEKRIVNLWLDCSIDNIYLDTGVKVIRELYD